MAGLLILQQGVPVGHAFGPNPFLEAARLKSSLTKLDQCFCELTGPVDICCCDVETVDSLNNKQIYPIISNLVKQSYFRYYKINLHRVCPFWSDDGRCVLKDCHVEQCPEEEVPSFLKGDEVPVAKDHVTCDHVTEEEKVLSSIVDAVSIKQAEEFNQWILHDEAQSSFCYLEDETSAESSYIDLLLNPERYTGYSGHSPHRIWTAIYHENCFRSDQNLSSNPFSISSLKEMCLEKRAFYRLISGMHSSINVHLSANYISSGALSDNPKFGPNLNEFIKRFDSSTTGGRGPGWLKNLYFAYLVVLRAITKAESVWSGYYFYTGNTTEDELIRQKVQGLISAAKGCGHSLFDESQMFNGNTSAQLKEEFRSHFYNISRIMDCVGCNKCRLWGTVQVQGIGTALKILFAKPHHLHLRRLEIVALFNVLGKLSSSIKYLDQFRNMQVEKSHSHATRTKT